MTELMTRNVLAGANEAGNRDLYLTLPDEHSEAEEPYKRYLATTATYPTNEPPAEHELKVATVRFNGLVDEPAKTKDLTQGWIYLFVNGRLWREIQVMDRYQYRDVNLERYQGEAEDARFAQCETKDTVVIPISFAGEAFALEAAYSEQQWSWARIEELGGVELTKADRQSSADSNELRQMRCCVLDYEQALEQNDDDAFAISPLSVRDYEVAEVAKQELIFSLPHWLEQGRAIKEKHDDVLGEITFLRHALADVEFRKQFLPPGDDQLKKAEFKVSELQLALFTAREVCYGQAKVNLQNGRRAYLNDDLFDEATQQRMAAGRARLNLSEQVDIPRLESVLHTTRFLELKNETDAAKERMMALLEKPRFVAMMRDYATLGSDERSAMRVKGLIAFTDIFDGFNVCAYSLIEPHLADTEWLRDYGPGEVRNPMVDFLPRLLNLDDNPLELYHLLFDFEALYPALYAEFSNNLAMQKQQDPHTQSFSERYNPVNKGIADELSEELGTEAAQQLLKNLFKFLAGLMVLNESELDLMAKSSSPIASDSRLAGDDGYDEVIQKQRTEVADLEKQVESLLKEQSKLNIQIANLEAECLEEKGRISASRKKIAELEVQFQISEPTSNQLQELQDLKAQVSINESNLTNLDLSLEHLRDQRTDTETQLYHKRRQVQLKKRRTQRQPQQQTRTLSSHVDSNVKQGLGTKSHLKVGEMSHFIGGSRVVQVTMNIDDVLDGKFPPHLIPTNTQGIERLQQRRANAFNLIQSKSGPLVQVNALGVPFPVPDQALQTNRQDVQWTLNGLAAAMVDHQQRVPAATVDMYCFRADIDIELSERQWNSVQQIQINREIYDDYLKASESLKSQRLNYQQQRMQLEGLKYKLLTLTREQTATIDKAHQYRQNTAQLIRRDQHIHWVQGPLQGVVLVFDINNMIHRWQAVQHSPSLKVWWDAGSSVIDVVGSTVDVFESGFRSLSATNQVNYHNLKESWRTRFRVGGKLFGTAGGIISIVSGYFDLITARTLNDLKRYIGGGLAIVSGVAMIVAIAVSGSLALPLAIVGLGAGLVAAMFAAFYDSSEEIHWKHACFGKRHSDHASKPGLENWSDPAVCQKGLQSLIGRPDIRIEKDDEWVVLKVQTGSLPSSSTAIIELDVKGDFNIGNEDEYPWLPLHNEAIAAADARQHTQAEKQESQKTELSQTYGVPFYRLAAGAHIQEQGNERVYRYDRRLFEEMLHHLNKAYDQNREIDDLLFQIRVRAVGSQGSDSLPSAYYDAELSLNQDQVVNKVDQQRYYTHNEPAWWYRQAFELDLI